MISHSRMGVAFRAVLSTASASGSLATIVEGTPSDNQGGSWYTAETGAAVAAIPPGFLFTGFSGGLSGASRPASASGFSGIRGNPQCPGRCPVRALFDFSGCPPNARFSITVNIGYMSNGSSSRGVIQPANQIQ
jgi:hypothetical protein